MSVSDRTAGGDKPEKRPASMIERLRALFGMSQASIREDIEDALEDPEGGETFSPQERAMLRNVLDFHELRVADVMVPRADIIAVSIDMTLGQVLSSFRTAGHSRLPVYGDTLDDARGMVHIRDFVAHLVPPLAEAEADAAAAAGKAEPDATAVVPPSGMNLAPDALGQTLKDSGLVRPVLFVPPSMQALDLLVRMQAFRTHMALVIDEYGGTDGLVSIEDIVEMIVGDIEDEHDVGEDPKVVMALDGSYIADARAGIDDVSAMIGVDLESDKDAEEVDTLGGLIGALAGHVPGRGEIVRTARGTVEFEVLDADPRRVKRVRIRRVAPPAPAGSTAAGRETPPVAAPASDSGTPTAA
jgi:CBS domain containing-hemolysin-like protein